MIPFFSIVIATYNSEFFLERTLKSIINQDFENYELIIIDGLSNDNTMSIVGKYKKYISTIVSEKDHGIYDAWNKGVNLSKGEWIMFVGSDDLLYLDALKNYHDFVKSNPKDYNYVSSKVQLIDEKENILRVIGRPWNWQIFKKYMCVAHVASIHHHSLYEMYGLYNTNYKITGDYEFLLRVGKKLKGGFFDKITAKMQIGGVSNMNNKVFIETYKAKIDNNSRSVLLAKCDDLIARIIYYARNLLAK